MSLVDDIPIIDVDTHVVEPPDLWTSRLSSANGATSCPRCAGTSGRRRTSWFIGDQRVSRRRRPRRWPGGTSTRRAHPDAGRTSTRPRGIQPRLARMDEYGIHAQILYPNVALFRSASCRACADRRAGARAASRLQRLPDATSRSDRARIASSRSPRCPFWDLDATLAEMERCAETGHRGVIFTQDPAYFGLPDLTDRHWDRMWAAAQEHGLPINFHIASGDNSLLETGRPP